MWDLGEGSKIGEPLVEGSAGGNVTPPRVLITRVGDGLAVVSNAGTDGRLRAWDPDHQHRVTKPLDGHRGQLTAVAETEYDAHPLAVTARHGSGTPLPPSPWANPGRFRRHRLGRTAT